MLFTSSHAPETTKRRVEKCLEVRPRLPNMRQHLSVTLEREHGRTTRERMRARGCRNLLCVTLVLEGYTSWFYFEASTGQDCHEHQYQLLPVRFFLEIIEDNSTMLAWLERSVQPHAIGWRTTYRHKAWRIQSPQIHLQLVSELSAYCS